MAAMLGSTIKMQFTRSVVIAPAERAATVSEVDRNQIVRSDMERVFRPLAGRSPAPEHQAALDRHARAGRGSAGLRGGFRWLTFAAPVLLVLFVAAFAIRFATVESAASRTARKPSAGPLAPAAAPRDTAVIASSAAKPSPVPGIVLKIVELARADRSRPSTAEPSEPTPREAAPAPRAGAPAVPARAALADKGRRTESRAARVGTAPVLAAVKSKARPPRARTRPSPAEARCPPGSLEDRCIYQDVLNADARLRAAYERATRNGVRTSELAAVRRRWARAQRSSLDEPDETIGRYGRLADELDSLSGAERW